jgi:Zn-dependent M28 family amino/carboxypeptidase
VARSRTLPVLVALLVVVAACSSEAPAPPAPEVGRPAPVDPGLPQRLAGQVSVDGAFSQLRTWQEIADRNGHNRESGTPGHEQSVDDVAGKLRAAGFRVDTPSFTFDTFEPGPQTLAVDGRPGPGVQALQYSPATPPAGTTAPLVVIPPADPSPGCEPTDYAGLPARGAVVLVRRGVCTFSIKQQVAADAGAAAVLVANNAPGPVNGSLESKAAGRIPTGGISQTDGDALVGRPGTPVTLVLATRTETRQTRNVIAQTTTGRTDEVIMAGAHLDSVHEGPGINDNGSGSAAQLETALRLGSAPPVRNAVRFAWWGAEEYGLLGSEDYVKKLSPDAKRDIALVLNDDMLGSPNPAYLAYDGDNSDRVGEPAGPPGSDAIERTALAALATQGVQGRGTDFDGRSDYGPFVEAGIPAGGFFTGAEGDMTPEQAQLWGGQAGKPYDPCYHQACDTIADVDRTALERMMRAFATTVATYAVDSGGPNGVPARDQRTPK